jgi:hypothetical protein
VLKFEPKNLETAVKAAVDLIFAVYVMSLFRKAFQDITNVDGNSLSLYYHHVL